MIETRLTATVLTNSLPVMELVFNQGGTHLDLVGVGGTLRRLTRSFVGPAAVRTVLAHYADRLIMSVKGLTAAGLMTDADPLEAEVKRVMIGQSDVSVAARRRLEAVRPRAQRDRHGGGRHRRAGRRA